jgi:hypothetical protein
MADKPPVNPELVMAWQAPGIMVNKVYMYFNGHSVRISFAEQGSPELPAVSRAAVVMAPGDAVEFSKALRTMLTGFEED